MLANFACDPAKTRGRLYHEEQSLYRNDFQRDKDRIIHSNSFRRLEYKTQVFVNHEGDHYRNRLTHSIEVAAVARAIARMLGLSEDLSEAIALAHDLGHTPFGHAGEDALALCMRPYGGFSHNGHTIKLLTQLEKKYTSYDGLNLTWEVLEGIAKHNGPITHKIPRAIANYNKDNDLELDKYSSAEAQVAALSDDIAYHGHDLEDGVRAGLFNIDDLKEMRFMEKIIKNISHKIDLKSNSTSIYEIVRELTHILIHDLIVNTQKRIKQHRIETPQDVRDLGEQLVDFSEEISEYNARIKKFLQERVYKHHRVTSMTHKANKVVKELFSLYFETPGIMPPEWRNRIRENNDESKAIVVSDYIAGMTDRFAIKEYQSFFNLLLTREF